MKSFFSKDLFAHPIVLWSLGAVVVIALGSGFYYFSASQAPAPLSEATSTSATLITAGGTVTPSQNPDLAFETGGRVATLNVRVGESVAKGSLLASLDTSALSAARAQAAANLRAAQAKLSEMQAGPRDVDVSAKQTAVAQAQQSLANLYTQAQNDISAAFSSSLGAVHADTDTLFNNPSGTNPSIAFTTNDNQLATNANNERGTINGSLASWQSAANAQTSDPVAVEAGIASSISRLNTLRQYADTLTQALSAAIPSSSFPQSSITAANSSLALFRSSVSASISSLQADSQQIASAKIAITSAQDSLNQTLAGSTAQDIEAQSAAVDAAQANLSAANAAISNAVIVAPFSGTVASVQVKIGDLVSPNTLAVSLTPQSALEVDAFLSEADAARVKAGDAAQVTLDAYGSGRTFAATVVSVDRAPTMQNGIPAYKITLQFVQDDPAISSGMTANVTLTPDQN